MENVGATERYGALQNTPGDIRQNVSATMAPLPGTIAEEELIRLMQSSQAPHELTRVNGYAGGMGVNTVSGVKCNPHFREFTGWLTRVRIPLACDTK